MGFFTCGGYACWFVAFVFCVLAIVLACSVAYSWFVVLVFFGFGVAL